MMIVEPVTQAAATLWVLAALHRCPRSCDQANSFEKSVQVLDESRSPQQALPVFCPCAPEPVTRRGGVAFRQTSQSLAKGAHRHDDARGFWGAAPGPAPVCPASFLIACPRGRLEPIRPAGEAPVGHRNILILNVLVADAPDDRRCFTATVSNDSCNGLDRPEISII